jgi:hypothetical protein
MISSADFTCLSSGGRALQHRQRTRREAPTAARGEADDIVSGRSHDHQRAVFMSATGQLRGRLRAVSRGRCQGIDYATWENFLRIMNCAGNPYTQGSPAVAAHNALAGISFPNPSGDRSPSQNQLYRGYPFTYTGLWTYYWTSVGWVTKSATANDGAQTATVTATPTALDFDPGDGLSSVTCDGPGRPWTASDGNSAPADGACGYQYRQVTSSPLTSTQTLVWTLTWKVSGDAGALPTTFSTSTSGQLNVMQIQTVVTR